MKYVKNFTVLNLTNYYVPLRTVKVGIIIAVNKTDGLIKKKKKLNIINFFH